MAILENIIAGVVSGISATAIVWLSVLLYRRRTIDRYKLNQKAKKALASLWDAGLLRPSSEIAAELDICEKELVNELGNLKNNGLIRIRRKNKDGKPLWKITWKGQEYLSQISWLGDLV
jgi:DNA-binding MarR family transcriptional regulator